MRCPTAPPRPVAPAPGTGTAPGIAAPRYRVSPCPGPEMRGKCKSEGGERGWVSRHQSWGYREVGTVGAEDAWRWGYPERGYPERGRLGDTDTFLIPPKSLLHPGGTRGLNTLHPHCSNASSRSIPGACPSIPSLTVGTDSVQTPDLTVGLLTKKLQLLCQTKNIYKCCTHRTAALHPFVPHPTPRAAPCCRDTPDLLSVGIQGHIPTLSSAPSHHGTAFSCCLWSDCSLVAF